MKIFQLARRGALALVTLFVSLAIVVGAIFAVAYGRSVLEARAANQPTPEAAPLIAVSVQRLHEEPGYQQTRRFVGQVEPRRTVTTSFELSGQLRRVLVDEGEFVDENQLLAELNTDLLQAERSASMSAREAINAQLDFALQTLERADALRDRGFASQERLDQARATRDELTARLNEIDANLATLDIRIAKSQLRAPFAGRVTQRFVDGGEALAPGQNVVQVIESAAPILRVGVPLSLAETSLRDAVVQLGGQEFEAEFVTLRPDIDPVTRTRTALFQLNEAPEFSFGQTAEVLVETYVATPGTWVPLDSLKEGARGQWSLLVLNDDNVVQRASAMIIHAESDRVFTIGSFPDGALMIESGSQRVVPGQLVAPQLVEAN